ncbi:MAG: TetR/AcrR family transcriptional regulator [Nocardioides sp.]
MANRRADVIAAAAELLDRHGLAELTMRRLAGDLGVQPSALYHHFANKQSLLAALADDLLDRDPWPDADLWQEHVAAICGRLHGCLLDWRDGAELVATVWSFGLGASRPFEMLVDALSPVGRLAPTAARTLLHFVYGHAVDEQTYLQAAQAGAISTGERDEAEFSTGLGIVIAGIQVAAAVRSV